MRRPQFNAFLLIVVALGLITLRPSVTLSQEKLEKIHIAYPTISMAMAPWWVAKEKGFFGQEGLDVDVMYIKGDGTIVQALIGGNIQAGYAGATPVAAAVARGGPVVIVAVPANRMGYLLMTREPVKDPRDLHGKRFAISSFGGSSEIATRLGLEKVGADPSKVVMLQVGGSPDRVAAMKRGSADGSILSANEVIGAGGMGFYTLYDFAKSDLDYPYNVLYVLRQFASEKRKPTAALVKSFMRGLWFMQENEDESVKISARWLKTSDLESLRRQWKYVAFQLHQEIPYPTEAGFKLALGGMAQTDPKAAALRMDEVTDVSIINELVRQGFFKRAKTVR
jgi:ABC-type nitrate/sulfonate/bicarbonate transport system substrate-binding protein